MSIRSQVNSSSENHYPSDDETEIVADDKYITRLIAYLVDGMMAGSGLKSVHKGKC
jgi:hypothetical protein